MIKRIVACSYEAPFLEKNGDHMRIRSIHDFISSETHRTLFCFCLGDTSSIIERNGSVYIARPRKLYNMIRKVLPFIRNDLLQDSLMKLSQLVFDEPFLILQMLESANATDTFLIHGDMSIAPAILRLFGFKRTIVFDSLANYSQTLYMHVHRVSLFRKAPNYLRLGIYLAIYRLQLRFCNKVLYPSTFDVRNSREMYHLEKHNKIAIVPNIFTIAYEDLELGRLRQQYRQKLNIENDTVVLVLAAGGRGKMNKEAVDTVVRLSEKELSKEHELLLIVTGPWLDYRKKTNLPSIFTGIVERSELRGILAASDVALAPMFEGSGTLLKVLDYLSSGLPIVATPVSLAGIPANWLSENRIYLVRNQFDFPSKIRQAIVDNVHNQRVAISKDLSCSAYRYFSDSLRDLLRT